jgi:hypothetical protein
MPLRATIIASPETLSDMLLAAEDRYREGEELLLAQEFDGCVYLFGYSVEMWLKAACMQLRGANATVGVMTVLPTLKPLLRFLTPGITRFDYHDLSLLAACVIWLRNAAGRPLSTAMLTALQVHVINGIYAEWMVDMRYRRSGLVATDAWAALQNAWWARNNWTQLT